MICEQCKKKPVARGMKMIHCNVCGHTAMVNCFHSIVICDKCSKELNICQYGDCNHRKEGNKS